MKKTDLREGDPGKAAAIAAAGGVLRLAATLGISGASVSGWDRIPAERVLQIERALDGRCTRHEMRPDLYPAEDEAA